MDRQARSSQPMGNDMGVSGSTLHMGATLGFNLDANGTGQALFSLWNAIAAKGGTGQQFEVRARMELQDAI